MVRRVYNRCNKPLAENIVDEPACELCGGVEFRVEDALMKEVVRYQCMRCSRVYDHCIPCQCILPMVSDQQEHYTRVASSYIAMSPTQRQDVRRQINRQICSLNAEKKLILQGMSPDAANYLQIQETLLADCKTCLEILEAVS